jgi:UDP-2,3-diacylglucosamine pyrophosphatase LpxH
MKPEKLQFKSVFISDLHLGSRGCQADALNDFLATVEADNLYLVGDIVDLWAMSRKFYFPQNHVNVLRKVLKKSKNGTRVVYIVGNHDETFRPLLPFDFGEIEIVNEIIHYGLDGKRYLVTHGDDYDQIVLHAKWVAQLGDIGYSFLLQSNRWINAVRNFFHLPHWSLSNYVKAKVKGAANFICGYEDAVAKAVKDRHLDGVVCGHIHHAEIKTIEGVQYMNDGDWVESCTALVENLDGTFEIIRWFDLVRQQSQTNVEIAA